MTDIALTELQQHMLRELARGKRLKEISRERGVSSGAGKGMSKILMLKLGLRTQFQLGAWAERHGYGVPPMADLSKGRPGV
jgi:DNA-binding NarL/FixJ family response regulator